MVAVIGNCPTEMMIKLLVGSFDFCGSGRVGRELILPEECRQKSRSQHWERMRGAFVNVRLSDWLSSAMCLEYLPKICWISRFEGRAWRSRKPSSLSIFD